MFCISFISNFRVLFFIFISLRKLALRIMSQIDKDPRIKCAIDYIEVDGERFSYAKQMMRRNYLCLLTKDQSTQPECPLYVTRTSQINQLDRRYFLHTFVKEIIKSLEKMDPQNCTIIIKKVPKNIKYMSAIFKIISIQKLSKLLQDNSFFLQLYVLLEQTLSKRKSTNLSFVQESLKTMQLSYQRLFFLLDQLVLENQTFRNVLVNCTKQIVIEQMAKQDFHQNQIFKKRIMKKNEEYQIEEQNDSKELNSSADTISESSKMSKTPVCVQSFVNNSLGVLKSLQKLKCNAQQINQFLFQDKFCAKIRQNFIQLSEIQHFSQLLQLFSMYNSVNLWQKILEKQKNLEHFEKSGYKLLIKLTENTKQQPLNLSEVKQKRQNIKKKWIRFIHILQQLLKLYNKQATTFVQRIILAILQSEVFIQNIPFVSIFLQIKFKDIQSFRSQINMDTYFLNQLRKKIEQVLLMSKTYTCKSGQSQSQKGYQINFGKTKSKFSKRVLILLLQTYRTLIQNQQKLGLDLSSEPIKHLLFLCKSQKGAIFGCRQSFIRFLQNKIKHYQDEQRMKNNLCKNEQLQKENLFFAEDNQADNASISKYKGILEYCESESKKKFQLANAN